MEARQFIFDYHETIKAELEEECQNAINKLNQTKLTPTATVEQQFLMEYNSSIEITINKSLKKFENLMETNDKFYLMYNKHLNW